MGGGSALLTEQFLLKESVEVWPGHNRMALLSRPGFRGPHSLGFPWSRPSGLKTVLAGMAML